MSVEVRWDNAERTVIHCYFNKQWDMNDLLLAEQKIIVMLDERPDCVVDIIINVEESLSWPKNSFAGFKNVLGRITRGNGLKVIVEANTFLETLFRVYGKSNKDFIEGLTFVKNLQDARDLLEL